MRLLYLPLHDLGEGSVDKPRNEIVFEDMINILGIAIKEAAGRHRQRKVGVFGHSMGGIIAANCLDEGIDTVAFYCTPDVSSLCYTPFIKPMIRVMAAFNIEFPIRWMIKMFLDNPSLDYSRSIDEWETLV